MRWLITINDVNGINHDLDSWTTWLAKNIPYKNKLMQIILEKEEILDWIAGTNRFDYVGRKFSADMTWKTAKRLCDEWHARREFGPLVDKQFPEPWLPREEINGYVIEPITNTIALYEEGKEMHHCVYSYAQRVFNGDCYIYSIKKKDKRIATMEVNRRALTLLHIPLSLEYNPVTIGQLRGPCNKSPDGKIFSISKTWLDKNISKAKVPVETIMKIAQLNCMALAV